MNWVSVQIHSSLFSKGEENHNYMKKLRRKLFDGKGGGGGAFAEFLAMVLPAARTKFLLCLIQYD